MTGNELKSIRATLGIPPREMRAMLGLQRRAYEQYEAGNRQIPAEVADKARDIGERDKRGMASAIAKVRSMLEMQFPFGIQSIQEVEE